MRIVFIRHGESEANVLEEVNDNPARIVNLTEKGREQAIAAGEALRGTPFVHAYASEFPRTRQTAEIILRQQGCALSIDSRINERRSGMDGLPVRMFNDLVRPDRLRIRPAHGESFLEQMGRVRSFLDDLAESHHRGPVLAVSHQDPILAAMALTAEDPAAVATGHLANCQQVELSWPMGR